MTTRPATTAEIRRAFRADGHRVHISRDGRVTFKRGGIGPWLDGRWASEYAAVKLGDGRVSVTLMTPGQIAYEQDVAARPLYDDGTPRKAWCDLDDLSQRSWERNPAPRWARSAHATR